jgi:hypothetical protein
VFNKKNRYTIQLHAISLPQWVRKPEREDALLLLGEGGKHVCRFC